MSKAEEVKLHVKVVTNKEKTKVLFAEAGSDFTDVLCSFLLLPLGTIVRVLQKHKGDEVPIIGSLSTLYRGVVNLDSVHFSTEAAKEKLLAPTSSYENESSKLRLSVSSAQPMCPNSVTKYDGVFTEGAASFIISDDLCVMPNMRCSFMETLRNLGIDLAEVVGAETKSVAFGMREIISLLWVSLVSRNPLSTLLLPKCKMSLASAKSGQWNAPLHCINEKVKSMNPKKMILKAMIQKSTNKLLFAQADNDFVDFLFGLLMIPLGEVEWCLGSNTGLKSMDNLHRSIAEDSNKVHLKSAEAQVLLTMSNYHVALNEFSSLNFEADAKHHHVKGVRMFMVIDDLTVAPLAMTSCLSVINGVKISVWDVEERELQVGLEEGLSILKAALTSSTALTDGLMKPRLKGSLSSNSAVGDGIVHQTPSKRPKLEYGVLSVSFKTVG